MNPFSVESENLPNGKVKWKFISEADIFVEAFTHPKTVIFKTDLNVNLGVWKRCGGSGDIRIDGVTCSASASSGQAKILISNNATKNFWIKKGDQVAHIIFEKKA